MTNPDKARQLKLPFPSRGPAVPYILGDANRGTIAVLDQWWERFLDGVQPGPPVILLKGPKGAGKSTLLTRFMAARAGLVIVPGPDGRLMIPRTGAPLGIDDAHRARAEDLFSIFNECVAERRALILCGAGRPMSWGTAFGEDLADLKSRLSGVAIASLEAPDSVMLADALAGGLCALGYESDGDEIAKAADQLCRRFSAVETIVADIATRGGKPTVLKALLQAAMKDNPTHVL